MVHNDQVCVAVIINVTKRHDDGRRTCAKGGLGLKGSIAVTEQHAHGKSVPIRNHKIGFTVTVHVADHDGTRGGPRGVGDLIGENAGCNWLRKRIPSQVLNRPTIDQRQSELSVASNLADRNGIDRAGPRHRFRRSTIHTVNPTRCRQLEIQARRVHTAHGLTERHNKLDDSGQIRIDRSITIDRNDIRCHRVNRDHRPHGGRIC